MKINTTNGKKTKYTFVGNASRDRILLLSSLPCFRDKGKFFVSKWTDPRKSIRVYT